MAFFWTLAEVAILVAVQWGHELAAGGDHRRRGRVITAGVGVACLGGVLFWGESLLGLFVDLETHLHRTLFRWALWNFFCTVWVVLEGGIMIYVCRLYRILQGTDPAFGKGSGAPGKTPAGPYVLAAAFVCLYLIYQAALFHAVNRFGIQVRPVIQISLFYIRICGLFWILFEWIVAIQGIRAYRLLRRQGVW